MDRLRKEDLVKKLWFTYFAVLLFWALNAYSLLGQWLIQQQLFATKLDGRPFVSDFVNVYAAGTLARDCLQQPINIYDPLVQNALQLKLVAPVVPEQTFYCQYPPSMFAFFLPLSLMSMPLAWISWCALSIILSIVAISIVIYPEQKSRFARAIIIAAFLGAFPTWLSIRLGQTSLLLFPTVLLFWHLLRKQSWVWAAVVASLLVVKVQYVPFLAAAGFAVCGWRYLFCLGGVSALLLGIATAIVGPHNLIAWPQALFSRESSLGVSGVAPEKMQNIRGFLVLITGDDGKYVHIIVGLISIVAILAIYLAWKRFAWKNETTFYALASMTTLLMLVAGPHTHMQDYIIALIAAVWLFTSLDRTDRLSAKRKFWCKFAVAGFPLVGWVFFFLLQVFQLLKLQPFALWAILVVWLAAPILFNQQQSQSDTTATGDAEP